MKTDFSPQKGCGQLAIFVVSCFNAYLFKNCPDTVWNNSKFNELNHVPKLDHIL